MIRRFVLPVLMGTLVVGAIPALADGNGSTEQKTVSRSCTAATDPHYSAPTSTDCQTDANGAYTGGNAQGPGYYDSTFDSNEVTCGTTNEQSPANPTGVHLYGAGDPTTPSGGLGVCSDGAVPVQGRVGISGNPNDGLTVTADGDNSNNTPASDKGTGYAIVNVGTGGPSVVCGAAWSKGGNGNSDNPVGASQANCQ